MLFSEARNIQSVPPISDNLSVTVNDDNTLSFYYCGPAKRVSVQSNLLYRKAETSRHAKHIRRLKMHKHDDGCFHVTTPPVCPEAYTYCFRINGKRQTDLLNNDTAWLKLHKWNVISVGGSEQANLYLYPKRQGELIRTKWYSTEEKIFRRVSIYLPAAYMEDQSNDVQGTKTGYPVLYLIHGINGYEGSWVEQGRAIQVLENLVAHGKLEPVILVMPDCNVGPHEDKPSHHTLWNNIMHYSRLQHDHRIERAVGELMTMVDTTYRVSDKKAIAGLSDGARIAANVANNHPNTFTAVGMFSPVVHKSQLPCDTCSATQYYIYIGKQDLFYLNGKRFYKNLSNQERNTTALSSSVGGHNWRYWRRNFTDFISLIFAK